MDRPTPRCAGRHFSLDHLGVVSTALTRRQQRAVSRGAQYTLFVAAVAALVGSADWGRLANEFAQPELVRQLLPEIVTTALRNTVVYTLSGFAVGLLLGLVIALMRLSSWRRTDGPRACTSSCSGGFRRC